MGARFELVLDGDAEILPGLSVVVTPGHAASSHQCVLVRHRADGVSTCLIGDAAYTPREYTEPLDQKSASPGQAADRPSWEARRSAGSESMTPSRVHFCHPHGRRAPWPPAPGNPPRETSKSCSDS